MAKSPSRSIITSALASALLAGGLVAATATPASAATYTFNVTTSPAVQYAQVSVSLRDNNGWDQGGGVGGGTGTDGTATLTVNADSGTTYVLAVSPPTDVSDDSAPFLATSTLSGPVAPTVVFPTKNITYTVVSPDGVTPVPDVYVSIGRPFIQDGQRRGATNIVGGQVNSAGKYFVYLQDGNSLINSDPTYG